jgi:hypothetical protein
MSSALGLAVRAGARAVLLPQAALGRPAVLARAYHNKVCVCACVCVCSVSAGVVRKFHHADASPVIARCGAQVIDHYENPRNVGSLDKSDLSVGTGVVGAPACGDVMKLQIKVRARPSARTCRRL